LHDWSDDEASIILRNYRRAIASDGRLLIVETVLPSGTAPHHGKILRVTSRLVAKFFRPSDIGWLHALPISIATGLALSLIDSTERPALIPSLAAKAHRN